jgi:catechol 2,3-dioxygenase-like lactoylglutathione lyase family enzyme
MATTQQRFDVGGVLMPQPFKIRRLGHFGFNVYNMRECLTFYRDLLGFKVSDEARMGMDDPKVQEMLKETGADGRGYFFHYGADHHAFVLFSSRVQDALGRTRRREDVDINQVTWQVGSLAEVVRGYHYFQDEEVPVQRVGRDMPGSNWHVYILDPDSHVNELYYGIEQVGWLGRSKPRDMHYRRFREEPELPQMSEEAEVDEAAEKGIDVYSGYRGVETLPPDHDVEGVLLPRPFKITRIGPVDLFVDDVAQSTAFYTERLGFVLTEEVSYKGSRVAFLRNGTEHHSLGLFPKSLREELGCSDASTCMSFGIEVGSYQQLRNGVAFLKEHGVEFREIPAELHPGIDYSAYAIDPEGHAIQIYYYMEQIGWDGRPRPPELRRQGAPGSDSAAWPEALEPLSDTYADQTFQGPLG